MSKTIKKVFLIIGMLVLCFLVWSMFFNDGGILKIGYNAVATGINSAWHNISGNDEIVPEWGDNGTGDNGSAFDMDGTP
jgi:hypothetical protein